MLRNTKARMWKSAVRDYYDRNKIPYDPADFPDCSHCEACSAH